MKKLINMAFLYGFLGLISGVFYREFTKFMGYRGTTTLSVLHVHLLVLGFTLFLILALFAGRSDLTSDKMFKRFYSIYSVGFPMMIVTFLARGIIQVVGGEIPKAVSASISGVAGISHILITVAFVYLMLALKKTCVKDPS